MSVKTVSFYLLVLFFILAGLNHFINPDFYIPLIPDYLPFRKELNVISGILELFLAIGLFFPKYRHVSSLGLIVLMIVFLPSHIYFIEKGSCIEGSICVSPLIAWIRLIIIHPLIVYWIWTIRKV